MSHRRFLSILFGTALASWISLGLVIWRLEPCTAAGVLSLCHTVSSLALLLFFLSAFFALTASFTLCGFGLRLWFHHYEIYLDHLNISLRQGILLALCTLTALALLLLNALTWWSGVLLIGITMLVEFYFSNV